MKHTEKYFDGSLLLAMLESQLQHALNEKQEVGKLPEIVDHIKELERKTRYTYVSPMSIEDKITHNFW
jgi:hypothetical protein